MINDVGENCFVDVAHALFQDMQEESCALTGTLGSLWRRILALRSVHNAGYSTTTENVLL